MSTPRRFLKFLCIIAVLLSGILMACDSYPDYEVPPSSCSGFGFKKVSVAELRKYHKGQTVYISDSLQWDAVVVSSDALSNLFGEIYLQDHMDSSSGGVVFYTDLLETHARVPFGTRVSINLKGLYLGETSGSLELGGAFSSFGNLSVGRLAASLFSKHIRIHCDQEKSLMPLQTSISELTDRMLNTWIQIQGVEFIDSELGLPFAESGKEIQRTLIDCEGNTLSVKNSGYSDFYDEILPDNHGKVKGVLSIHRGDYELRVMDSRDFDFEEPRCVERQVLVGSDSLLISEIADPDNAPGARFLELYNASTTRIDLSGWELIRYTNANTEPGRAIELQGLLIEGHSAVVISSNASKFQEVFGFPPDAVIAVNGPADSNGDDTILLVDPFGNIKDTFGNPGIDGSGTSHEFEDGQAERKFHFRVSSPVFDPLQWNIYNDTGGNGTIKEPRQAPGDYTPGRHSEL